jgi:hypothetical protein
MTLLFEDMIRVETDKYVCRIWRGFDGDYGNSTNDELKDAAKAMLTEGMRYQRGHPKYLAEIVCALVKVERVNSVEIVDRAGNGICVHKDWP